MSLFFMNKYFRNDTKKSSEVDPRFMFAFDELEFKKASISLLAMNVPAEREFDFICQKTNNKDFKDFISKIFLVKRHIEIDETT